MRVFVFFVLMIALLLSENSSAQLRHTWRMGSENITKYISDGPPPRSINGNLMCVEAQMDSPFDSYALVNNTLVEVTLPSTESRTVFKYLATVNHRGRKDFSSLSETLTGHFAPDVIPLAYIRYCVNHERLFGLKVQPSLVRRDIIVDWMIFIGDITYTANARQAKFFFPISPLQPTECRNFGVGNPFPSHITFTTVQVDFAGVTPYELPTWMDTVEGRNARVCISSHSDSGYSTRPSANVTVLLIKNATNPLNSGPDINSPTYFHEVNSIPLNWPTTGDIRVVCVDVLFKKEFQYTPLIYGGVSFAPKPFASTVVEQPVTNWVEYVTEKGFRGCVARMRYAGLAPPTVSPSFHYLAATREGFTDNINRLYRAAASGYFTFQNASRHIVYANLRRGRIFGQLNQLLSELSGKPQNRFFTRLYGWQIHPTISDFAFFFHFKPDDSNPDNADFDQVIPAIRRNLPNPIIAYPRNHAGALSYRFLSFLLYRYNPALNQTTNYTTGIIMPCSYTPYVGSKCSAANCGDLNNGGLIDLSRQTRGRPSHPENCTKLTTTEPCKRQPCNIINGQSAFFKESGKFPSTQSNLTWLWVLLGVVAFIGVAGAGVYIFMRMKSVDGQGRKTLLGGGPIVIKKATIETIGS